MRPFPEAGDEQGNRDGDDERASTQPTAATNAFVVNLASPPLPLSSPLILLPPPSSQSPLPSLYRIRFASRVGGGGGAAVATYDSASPGQGASTDAR